jgi:hypothetical protein
VRSESLPARRSGRCARWMVRESLGVHLGVREDWAQMASRGFGLRRVIHRGHIDSLGLRSRSFYVQALWTGLVQPCRSAEMDSNNKDFRNSSEP